MKTLRLFLILGGLAAAVGLGCHSHDHDHHGDEPPDHQITVWTDLYEVFVEHPAPVAGAATLFATHVTDLRTFEPRHQGVIKVVMRQGDEVIEQTEAAPAKPGRCSLILRFPRPGAWRLTMLISTAGTQAEVELGTVEVYADAHAALHAAPTDHPDGVTFLKEQQWSLHLRSALVDRRSLVERVRVVAQVRPKPGHSAGVIAPMSGQLRLAPGSNAPQPGQRVEAGQVLAWLTPVFSEAAARLADAEAAFGAAKAALEQTEAAYARTKHLVTVNARAPRELEEAELSRQTARAQHAAAAGLLATFKTTGDTSSLTNALVMELRAPIAGVLNTVSAGPGEMVTADQLLFTVLNPETVWLEARIPEAALPRLNTAGDAIAVLPGELDRHLPVTGDGRGQRMTLGLEVDPATRTVPLLYEVANHEGLFRIGQSLALKVATAHAEEALAIPESALVEEGGRPMAFVQVAGETFVKRHLQLGLQDRGWVQVLAGLEAGERVVTQGAFAIRLASLSGVIPAHGHTH